MQTINIHEIVSLSRDAAIIEKNGDHCLIWLAINSNLPKLLQTYIYSHWNRQHW